MAQYFRNQKEYRMGDAINEFLKKYRLNDGYTHMQIATIWNETLGKVIALYTKKVELSNGKLIVYITSPIVKNELNMSKSDIILKLNEKIGKKLIKEIIIR
jgi:predicted nucleic acid-binding Zn ribbon protein